MGNVVLLAKIKKSAYLWVPIKASHLEKKLQTKKIMVGNTVYSFPEGPLIDTNIVLNVKRVTIVVQNFIVLSVKFQAHEVPNGTQIFFEFELQKMQRLLLVILFSLLFLMQIAIITSSLVNHEGFSVPVLIPIFMALFTFFLIRIGMFIEIRRFISAFRFVLQSE